VALSGEGPLIVGRSEDAQIRLDRPSVSRRHARLSRRGAAPWQIEDLGSRAGTFVNGRRVKQAVLETGDRVAVSRFGLRVVASSGGDRSPLGSDTWEEDRVEPQVSILTGVTPPKLDTSHIASLYDFGRRLVETESPDTRLQMLCDLLVGPVVGARWCMVLQIDEEDVTRPPRRRAGAGRPVLEGEALHLSRTAIRAMRQADAPILATNFGENQAVSMTMDAAAPVTAVVVCPLSDGAGQDLLYVNLPPVLGSTEWLALIALSAKQHAQAEAVWSARQAAQAQAAVERDLANARRIQTSVLPPPLEVSGLEVFWSFRPCDEVGGDYVDAIVLPDGVVMLIVADVSGHGMPAALAALAAHSVVHTGIRAGMTLGQIVSALNGHACDYLPAHCFITMLCIVLDPETGQLRYVNAGHHAPVLLAAGSSRSLREADNPPLGIEPEAFTELTDVLEAGETLFMSSDGIVEMPVGDDMLGSAGADRMVAEALAADVESLSDVIDGLRRDFDRVEAAAPVDDQTFLLARRAR